MTTLGERIRQEGIQEGRQEERQKIEWEIVRESFGRGLSLDIIAGITQLSKARVQQMIAAIKKGNTSPKSND